MRNAPLREHRAYSMLAVLSLVIGLAACGKPPARMAYDSIDGATVAVQGALRAFNILYQNGQATEADRATAKRIYLVYQDVAVAATYIAETVTTKEEAQAAIKKVSDAATKAVSELEMLSSNVRARSPAGR